MISIFLDFLKKYRKIILAIGVFFLIERLAMQFPAWFALVILIFLGYLMRGRLISFLPRMAIGCLVMMIRLALGAFFLVLVVTLFFKALGEVF